MNGDRGQQIIDDIRSYHAALLEGFGVWYVAALALSALYVLLWVSKQYREAKAKTRRRRAAARRAKARGRNGRVRAA